MHRVCRPARMAQSGSTPHYLWMCVIWKPVSCIGQATVLLRMVTGFSWTGIPEWGYLDSANEMFLSPNKGLGEFLFFILFIIFTHLCRSSSLAVVYSTLAELYPNRQHFVQ